MSPPSTQRQVYTVGALTRDIKTLLERGFSTLWVEGELGNFTAARSGHWYFTLKDEAAQLSAVMFHAQNRLLHTPPSEGARVLVRGRLNVYEPRGSYQLIADHMEDLGEGQLRKRFEELKNKLEAEGLFDPARKRPLPALPTRVALVTSPEGAAVMDMIRVMTRRNPRARLVIVPTLVQGESAASEIAQALRRAAALDEVDLIVVGRGGGSLEDLWAFNEEVVVRAIAASPLPVVSAVGHETDVTLADFVADLRAATPSVAGELVMPVLSDLEQGLSQLAQRLHRVMHHRLVAKRLDLERLSGRLPSPRQSLSDRRLQIERLAARLRSPRDRLADLRLRLDALAHRLQGAATRPVRRTQQRFRRLDQRLAALSPRAPFEKQKARCRDLERRLVFMADRERGNRRETLGRLALKLEAISPLAVLSRGYSLVVDERGAPLRTADQVQTGDLLRIYPASGELEARVLGSRRCTRARSDESS